MDGITWLSRGTKLVKNMVTLGTGIKYLINIIGTYIRLINRFNLKIRFLIKGYFFITLSSVILSIN